MMCKWKSTRVGDGLPYGDREVLVYLEGDAAVYFGFCEDLEETEEEEKRVWHVNFDGDYQVVDEKEILCWLEFPDIDVVALDIPIHNGGA